MTALTIPPLSPFPGRGAAPEDYIAQADTTMQELPSRFAAINAISEALNITAGIGSIGYLPPVAYAAGIVMTVGVQQVQYAGVTYAPILDALPFTTSGTFEADKFRVVQGVTRDELAKPAAAETLGARDGSVQTWLDILRGGSAAVHIDLFLGLDDPVTAAINTLPASGGVVIGSLRRYPPTNYSPTNMMRRENITMLGASLPAPSDNCDRLVAGSVLEGRFYVFANNFTSHNFGYDCGKYVTDKYWPGYDTHSPNHPLGGPWDAFVHGQPNPSAPLAPTRNLRIGSLIGLCRDSLTYGHAVLCEAFDGGQFDDVCGIYSVHGAVIKGMRPVVGRLAGYSASSDHVILKSDNYAPGGLLQITSLQGAAAYPGTIPWSTPAICEFGLYINAGEYDLAGVQIGNLSLSGARQLIRMSGTTPGRNIDNIQVASARLDGAGVENVIAMNCFNAVFNRIHFNSLTIANVSDGIAYTQNVSFGQAALVVDSLVLENVSGRAILADGYGQIVIRDLTARNIGQMYSINSTARVVVHGRPSLANVTSMFGAGGPAITNGWEQDPSGGPFSIGLGLGGAMTTGRLQPTGSPGPNVISLPPYMRPPVPVELPTLGRNLADEVKLIPVFLSSDYAYMAINRGTGVSGAESELSLDGIHWPVA